MWFLSYFFAFSHSEFSNVFLCHDIMYPKSNRMFLKKFLEIFGPIFVLFVFFCFEGGLAAIKNRLFDQKMVQKYIRFRDYSGDRRQQKNLFLTKSILEISSETYNYRWYTLSWPKKTISRLWDTKFRDQDRKCDSTGLTIHKLKSTKWIIILSTPRTKTW